MALRDLFKGIKTDSRREIIIFSLQERPISSGQLESFAYDLAGELTRATGRRIAVFRREDNKNKSYSPLFLIDEIYFENERKRDPDYKDNSLESSEYKYSLTTSGCGVGEVMLLPTKDPSENNRVFHLLLDLVDQYKCKTREAPNFFK